MRDHCRKRTSIPCAEHHNRIQREQLHWTLNGNYSAGHIDRYAHLFLQRNPEGGVHGQGSMYAGDVCFHPLLIVCTQSTCEPTYSLLPLIVVKYDHMINF